MCPVVTALSLNLHAIQRSKVRFGACQNSDMSGNDYDDDDYDEEEEEEEHGGRRDAA